MAGFIGTYDCSLDEKMRLTLPSKLRRNLPEEKKDLVIARGLDHCLFLYPQETWDQLVKQFQEKLNPFNEKDRLFLRSFLMWGEYVTLDNQSRILIPQKHLTLANIKNQVRLIGSLEKIEIWSPDKLDTYVETNTTESWEEIAATVMGGV